MMDKLGWENCTRSFPDQVSLASSGNINTSCDKWRASLSYLTRCLKPIYSIINSNTNLSKNICQASHKAEQSSEVVTPLNTPSLFLCGMRICLTHHRITALSQEINNLDFLHKILLGKKSQDRLCSLLATLEHAEGKPFRDVTYSRRPYQLVAAAPCVVCQFVKFPDLYT